MSVSHSDIILFTIRVTNHLSPENICTIGGGQTIPLRVADGGQTFYFRKCGADDIADVAHTHAHTHTRAHTHTNKHTTHCVVPHLSRQYLGGADDIADGGEEMRM